jgi:hypothetical protein
MATFLSFGIEPDLRGAPCPSPVQGAAGSEKEKRQRGYQQPLWVEEQKRVKAFHDAFHKNLS